jgi:hypothetical protein
LNKISPLKKILSSILILLFSYLSAQEKLSLNGVVRDADNNETLYGVNIIFPDLETGTITNEYGFYSIKIPKGKYKILVSYLGYQTLSTEINIEKSKSLNFSLTESSEILEEVVITENFERLNIRSPEMSVTKLEINTIKNLPVVFGEVDIVKSLLLLPGISNAGEGSSGFNVRGGAVGQNLILLDEATIFNASHLFGLFSVFNPDAIKNLKLYKGGIPAKYGGRVSSVLDIYQKDGNSKNFQVNGGIGLISSRLLAEGPIVEDKGSFLIGARSSYAHLFLNIIDNPNSAYFYDLNTKLSYQLDDHNRLLFSGYFGRDIFNISESFKNSYGNSVFNLRWNHVLTDNIFTNLSVIYSDYYYGLTLDFVEFNWNSGIKNLNLKYDFNQLLNEHISIDYGIQSTYYMFNPGEIEPSTPTSGINSFKLTKKYALENALYLSVTHKLSESFSATYGIRFSSFFRLGQDSLSLYQNNIPVIFDPNFGIYKEAVPIGQRILPKNEIEKTFLNWEPRLSVSYSFNDFKSIKFSYNRLSQYLQLISNTNSPTPLDVWTPSGKYIKPQLLDQISFGYFQNLKRESYKLEIEGFYKKVKNRLDYIDGANLVANNAIERVILHGKSRAYGMELLFRKNTGNFTGWIAYTLSKSEQKTEGRTALESGINNGDWYNTGYDKTHDISLTASYRLNKRWLLNTNFIFQTGLPTTYPTGQYKIENLTIPVYSARNSNRLPSYHRLDISATYSPKRKSNSNFTSSWNFGIYNVYNRKNAVSLNFRNNEDTNINEAVRLSLFGIIPSATYNFKF